MLKSSLKGRSTETRLKMLLHKPQKVKNLFFKKKKHLPFSKVISYCSLVEALSFVEKLGDVFLSVSEQLVLHQKYDALQRESSLYSSIITKQARIDGCACVFSFFKCTFLGSMLNFFLPIATCLLFCRVLLQEAQKQSMRRKTSLLADKQGLPFDNNNKKNDATHIVVSLHQMTAHIFKIIHVNGPVKQIFLGFADREFRVWNVYMAPFFHSTAL